MEGLSSGTTMHHVQTLKNKQKDDNVILENSSLSVDYPLNQSHDTSMWPFCDSFCFDQYTRSMEVEQSWVIGNADPLDINSDALAQPAQLSSVEELGSTGWDIWPICASEKLLLTFWFCLYRECFAMEKKELHLWQLAQNWGRPTKYCLISFQCLL